MTTQETNKLKGFQAAKKIALNIENNLSKRAVIDGIPVNYTGININGRMFVLGDTSDDLQSPNCKIHGKPAREVFGEFTIMTK